MFFYPTLNTQKILEKVRVRHLKCADLPALEWEGEYTHFRPMFERAYRRTETGEAVVWVADYARQLVGQVFVQLRSGRNGLVDGRTRAYVYAVRVRSAYRNLGLGSRLMYVVENDLIWRGYECATLNVARDNPDAQRFYERLGYRVVGEEDGRWSYTDHLGVTHLVHEPAWRMEKVLIPGQ
ncbi:MAG TPA: GNAT family N-acetyltransferase [Anaerolineales bacterium]|nr:GNAT family N-acetyltransferase [Anaerolineales bacterium]